MGMADIHGKEVKWHTNSDCKVESSCSFVSRFRVLISILEIGILSANWGSYMFIKLLWPVYTEKCAMGESHSSVHRAGITAREANERSRMTGWQMVAIFNQASWSIAWMSAISKRNNSALHHLSVRADTSFIYTPARVSAVFAWDHLYFGV